MQKHLQQMTIDDLLVSQNVTHAEYRKWLYLNGKPLYAITKGLYDEAILDDDPRHTFKLSRKETQKILYSKGWTEPRESKTEDIIKLLMHTPHYPQDYIAMTLGVTQVRVSQVARQYNLRPERKRRTSIDKEELLYLHSKNYSVSKIASLLKVSTSTVYKALACKNL